ncbi:Nn.00g011390.m01.CDS01 [Neocucurbitaria sp. VM-36]
MSKIITVFGATGNQGGSVIKHILADPALSQEFKIRGITRDTSKSAAKALSSKGVEMVSADLNSKDSLTAALDGSHTIFLVTNYWESASRDIEVTQGKNVADIAKKLNVQHLIFSTLLNVTKASGGRLPHVPHFDGKADVEEYIREIGVPATFYLPGYFMSNFEQFVKPGEDGALTLSLPVSDEAKFPLIDIKEDTGKFVKAIIKNRSKLLGEQILGSENYYTPKQLLDQITKSTGKETKFVQISEDVYKSFLPEFMAEEMLENHLFIEKPGYYAGEKLDKSHAILEDGLTSWKEFVEKSSAF